MPSMDRLSRLPDELISHILTFLPTKCSVQTSLLSKRWSLLWTHFPLLDFDFDKDCPLNLEIATKIMLQHKHDIHTFHLRGYFKGSKKEFESLIVNIITRNNIRNLIIALDHPFEFPQCLFACKTVVDFWLVCFDLTPESCVYFPALKKLRLDCTLNVSHESLAHLLSGCPVLEDFCFEGFLDGNFCVSSSKLTRLVLRLEYVGSSEFGLTLDTPTLSYLKLHCYMPNKFSVGALDSLIEAYINLHWDIQRQDNFTYSRNVLSLVGKMYNVKRLRLSASPVAMIRDSSFFASTIKFHNLTKLCLFSNFGVITCFLENSNNLRDLEVYMVDDIDNQYYWTPKQVPPCLISQLQTVNVFYFGAYKKHEFDMSRYILRNGKVLKRMEIRTQRKSSKAPNILLERASEECLLSLL